MPNTHRIERWLPLLFLAACGSGIATLHSDANTNPDGLAVACADPPDALASATGALGDVLRCSKIEELDAQALDARSRTFLGDVPHRAYTSGARIYRILYRTTRATVPKSAGVASALVYMPTAPRASRVPVIVVTHGGYGEAPDCQPSHLVSAPDQGGL